ncbi:MAG: ABC transporter ATP-binding protein [Bacteroidetes bacterium]|nr:ABC transporter ATP-binding protein [Bacteroidota bacterium]
MSIHSDETTSILSCRDLHCSYPGGAEALARVTFSVRQGERVGIIGPNGAGKSTLLRALIGLVPVDGDIIADGLRLAKHTLTEIRLRIGLVFQNPDDQLFSPTVGDDVAFGPSAMGLRREEVLERMRSALRDVGLEGAENRNPLLLSFGERRLAAIASVLSMRPTILAMDEPSSNLDPVHRRGLIRWIQDHTAYTLLLASHDLDMVAETCDRVLLLSRSIIADGPAHVLLRDSALLAAHGLEAPLGLQSLRFHSDS